MEHGDKMAQYRWAQYRRAEYKGRTVQEGIVQGEHSTRRAS